MMVMISARNLATEIDRILLFLVFWYIPRSCAGLYWSWSTPWPATPPSKNSADHFWYWHGIHSSIYSWLLSSWFPLRSCWQLNPFWSNWKTTPHPYPWNPTQCSPLGCKIPSRSCNWTTPRFCTIGSPPSNANGLIVPLLSLDLLSPCIWDKGPPTQLPKYLEICRKRQNL